MSRVLLVVALVLALAGSASSAAPRHGAPVSSVLPYVAPWQADFTRYSTQVVTPTRQSSNVLVLTVAEGQWWRLVGMFGNFITSAVAGNRQVRYQVLDSKGGTSWFQGAPASQPASGAYAYTFAPNLTSYASTAVLLGGVVVMGTPDVVWPPGTQLEMFADNVQAGDAWGGTIGASIEIYTEADRPGVLKPAPSPLVP